MIKRSAILLVGGTFDPIHVGHLVMAEWVREALGLPEVLFMPAGIPPHKGTVVASAQDRYHMVLMAVADNPHFQVSRYELDKTTPCYTVETLEYLRGQGHEVTLLVGADALAGMATWHRAEELHQLARLAVVARGDRIAPPPAAGVEVVDMPLIDVSSTLIRERLAQGKSCRYLLPEAVAGYLEERGLYRLSSA